MPELKRTTFCARYGGAAWILLAAVLSAGLAVSLVRYAIPMLLLRIEPSRILPESVTRFNLKLAGGSKPRWRRNLNPPGRSDTVS